MALDNTRHNGNLFTVLTQGRQSQHLLCVQHLFKKINMQITQVDFSDFVAIGTTSVLLLAGITAYYAKRGLSLDKENAELKVSLKEADITKSLSTVTQTVKQISDNQSLLKENLDKSLSEVFDRIRTIELKHAEGCALLLRLNQKTSEAS